MKEKRGLPRLYWPLIFLALTLSCLNSWTCRSKVETVPVFIGEARIVGKVEAGQIQWEPQENQGGKYFVVTEAYVKTCLGLALENSELRAEIKKLQASGPK